MMYLTLADGQGGALLLHIPERDELEGTILYRTGCARRPCYIYAWHVYLRLRTYYASQDCGARIRRVYLQQELTTRYHVRLVKPYYTRYG